MTPADRLNRVLAADRDWVTEARCRETDPSTFSPVDRRGRVDMPEVKRAAAVFCAACPVLAECRREAFRLAGAGFAPQELLVGGLWWPQAPYRGRKARPPVDLLGGKAEEVAA